MSDESKDFYHYNPFTHDHTREPSFPLFGENFDRFDPSFLSFNQSSNGVFEISSSSSDLTFPIENASKKACLEANEAPNLLVLSSSTEPVAEEEDPEKDIEDLKPKGCDDEDDKSRKMKQQKKKVEKRPKEPRFAFMTKSEIDNLEDGYRWRKYGQKAVKNSPFPRSYYRCTTQKCMVKKRIERSFQEPSIVITTYEGQHNHYSPATLRGTAASMLLSASSVGGRPSYPQQLLAQMFPVPSNLNPQSSMQFQHQQKLELSDYGLLQDIVPSFIHREEP